jgi:hypothetical protein
MPITISGTTVTFNDLSTQTTNVPNATAALTAGAVGTYAFLVFPSNTTARAVDFTVAGSSLRYAGLDGEGAGNGYVSGNGSTPGGTWRLMGQLINENVSAGKTTVVTNGIASVWLRIS